MSEEEDKEDRGFEKKEKHSTEWLERERGTRMVARNEKKKKKKRSQEREREERSRKASTTTTLPKRKKKK